MKIQNNRKSIMEAKRKRKKRNRPYSSITYTTGDPELNIKFFNKRMGSDFEEDPISQKAQAAAERAAQAISAVSSGSDTADSAASTGENFGGTGETIGEAFDLDEGKMYVAKHDKSFDLPIHISIIDKEKIEEELEKLEPEEEFEVGYITPVYFYKDIAEILTLLKCTQLVGYTGIDYIEARAQDDENREQRIKIAKETTALGTDNGKHLNRRPGAKEIGDFSANYASTNKTVLHDNGNTLLFYPKIGSRPKVMYYAYLHDQREYLPVTRDTLEKTIIQFLHQKAAELETGINKDGTPRQRRWTDASVARKIRNMLETDAKTIEAAPLKQEDQYETRSKISNGNVLKPQVRALYTGQIYYLKTPYVTLGKKLNESLQLTEAKRYVRRYYIRPQNIFCSNKTDIINTLIEFEDQNCSIYTLNNLGDEKDVTKLTNNDIIYYYDDYVLYDKNHVRIMDYDLYIKHEEQRKKINVNTVSDATFNDVYKDRLTGTSDIDEAFNLDFVDVNAYGEKLVEGKEIDGTCCICGEEIEGYGNNAEPYAEGRCCDACNIKFVIPARLEQFAEKDED